MKHFQSKSNPITFNSNSNSIQSIPIQIKFKSNPIQSIQSNPIQSNLNQQPFKQRQLNQQLRLGTGKEGFANGQFIYPFGITFDSKKQRVIVSDAWNHRLQFFNRYDLTHLLSVGSYGTNLAQFICPAGLCIQPSTNHLLICDESNHRVQVWSANDEDKVQPIYSIGRTGQSSHANGEFNRPIGVCCSPDGSFSVVDSNNHRVQRFDAGGRFLNTFGSKGKNEDQFQDPYDVCHLHHHFAPSSSASSLLLVTDYNNKRLSIWGADGHQHITNIQMDGRPRGVCVDLNGFMNVSCDSPHVYIYDPRKSYQLLQTLGDGQQGSAPGQFYFPTGMCVDDLNTLMVVDQDNHRVQFFD